MSWLPKILPSATRKSNSNGLRMFPSLWRHTRLFIWNDLIPKRSQKSWRLRNDPHNLSELRTFLGIPKTLMLSLCLSFALPGPASGQTDVYAYGNLHDQYYSFGVDATPTMLGQDIFGDRIDTLSGRFSATQIDIDIPGNSALPVRLARSTGDMENNFGLNVLMRDWMPSFPYVRARIRADETWRADRCTGAPYNGTGGNTAPLWSGFKLYTPDEGQREILTYTGGDWGDANVKYVTKNFWRITCINSIAAGGEGFKATSPEGITYHFDALRTGADRSAPENSYPNANLVSTTRVMLFASRIEDVNGNWVQFDYSDSTKFGPTRIYSNDGREISINYDAAGKVITSAAANGRTWTYSYSTGALPQLAQVTLPDGRSWSFTGLPMLTMIHDDPSNDYYCILMQDDQFVSSMTHPDGTVATYNANFEFIDLGEGVPNTVGYGSGNPVYVGHKNACEGNPNGVQYGQPSSAFAGFMPARSVNRRELNVPGASNYVWTYDYPDINAETHTANEGYMTYQAPLLRRSRIEPNGAKIDTYLINEWGWSHGAPYRVDVFENAADTTPLEQRFTTYGTYLSRIGGVTLTTNVFTVPHERKIEKDKEIVVRGTDTYTTEYFYDDDITSATWAARKPTEIRTYSSLNSEQRIQEFTYEHRKTPWVVALSKTVHRNNKLFDSNTYDAIGQPTTINRFGSTYATLSYNFDGTIDTVTDAAGNTLTLSNFKRGMPQSVTLPDTNTSSRTVDDNGWTTSETNARGFTTSYGYNNVGWLTFIDRPGSWADTTIAYSALGNGLTQTTTRDDLKTEVTYDGFIRPTLTKAEDLSGAAPTRYTKTQYDAFNRITFQSLPSTSSNPIEGVETDYDAIGRAIETRQTMAPFATTQYSFLSGNRIRITDPRNNITTTTYKSYAAPQDTRDAENAQPILIVPPLGATSEFDYDIYGNRISQRAINGSATLAETTTGYDSRLRPIAVTDPAGDISRIFYDVLDRPIVEKDGAGRATRTVYDSMGRVDKLIRAWAGTDAGSGELNCATMRNNYNPSTSYLQQCYQDNSYDPNGNLSAVSDSNGNTTNYTYNELDLPLRTTFPDASYSEVQLYDALGNPTQVRMRGGEIHTSLFDAFGQIIAMRTPTRDTAFAYDVAARRTCASVFSANGLNFNSAIDCASTTTNRQHKTSYTFDLAGRLLSEQASVTGGTALTTAYQYDAMDNRTRITWPDNYYAQYEYDALTRLTNVKENGSTILAHYDYDTQSRLTSITYGGATYGSGAARSQTTYVWEVDSDLDLLTHRFAGSTDVSFDYGYDGSGKLNSEIASLSDWIYNADSSRTDNYGVANNLNQYPSVNGLAVSYDLNGNRTAFDGLATPHDSENRLTGIGSTLTYTYDADGRRTARVQSSSITRFAHAGDMEIAEYDGATLTHRYIPGHSVDQRVAWKNIAAGTTHYFHADRLGSVQAVVNGANGTVTDQYLYTPFGVEEPLAITGNPFRYTGRRLDPESGLYYYRARYYDPAHGRFLETDPVGYTDQMNLYAYVGNDPLSATDPMGECTVTVISGSDGNRAGAVGFCPDNGLAANAVREAESHGETMFEELDKEAKAIGAEVRMVEGSVNGTGSRIVNDQLVVTISITEEGSIIPTIPTNIAPWEAEVSLTKVGPDAVGVHEGRHAMDHVKGVVGAAASIQKQTRERAREQAFGPMAKIVPATEARAMKRENQYYKLKNENIQRVDHETKPYGFK